SIDLLEIVRRPLSPDVRLEVQTSRDEHQQAREILERKESRYPQLRYDGARNVAIVVAPPGALHASMVTALSSNISRQLRGSQG
ncbi:hypothetical protein V1519DRAFT_434020, partial [Lipomyces tetrasporus]